jgi:hypothetical protein
MFHARQRRRGADSWDPGLCLMARHMHENATRGSPVAVSHRFVRRSGDLGLAGVSLVPGKNGTLEWRYCERTAAGVRLLLLDPLTATSSGTHQSQPYDSPGNHPGRSARELARGA